MKIVSAREFNQHTSAILREVLATSEPVTIAYRGKPGIAVLPIDRKLDPIEEMVLAGRASAPRQTPPLPGKAPFKFSVPVDDLLADTRDDR